MKKNQVLIVLSVLALVLIAIFFLRKKSSNEQLMVPSASDSTTAASPQNQTKSLSREQATTSMLIAYRFQIVDHTTLKNWHLFVSLNGAAATEITVAGIGCTNADGYNYIPITIDCPVSPATTPVTVDIILKKGTTVIKHELKTDDIASCGSPDILMMPVCGYKLRQFPTNPPTTPILNKIIVTVNEGPSETYDDVVSWPPSLH